MGQAGAEAAMPDAMRAADAGLATTWPANIDFLCCVFCSGLGWRDGVMWWRRAEAEEGAFGSHTRVFLLLSLLASYDRR